MVRIGSVEYIVPHEWRVLSNIPNMLNNHHHTSCYIGNTVTTVLSRFARETSANAWSITTCYFIAVLSSLGTMPERLRMESPRRRRGKLLISRCECHYCQSRHLAMSSRVLINSNRQVSLSIENWESASEKPTSALREKVDPCRFPYHWFWFWSGDRTRNFRRRTKFLWPPLFFSFLLFASKRTGTVNTGRRNIV